MKCIVTIQILISNLILSQIWDNEKQTLLSPFTSVVTEHSVKEGEKIKIVDVIFI